MRRGRRRGIERVKAYSAFSKQPPILLRETKKTPLLIGTDELLMSWLAATAKLNTLQSIGNNSSLRPSPRSHPAAPRRPKTRQKTIVAS